MSDLRSRADDAFEELDNRAQQYKQEQELERQKAEQSQTNPPHSEEQSSKIENNPEENEQTPQAISDPEMDMLKNGSTFAVVQTTEMDDGSVHQKTNFFYDSDNDGRLSDAEIDGKHILNAEQREDFAESVEDILEQNRQSVAEEYGFEGGIETAMQGRLSQVFGLAAFDASHESPEPKTPEPEQQPLISSPGGLGPS
jgi:hypothetical protein